VELWGDAAGVGVWQVTRVADRQAIQVVMCEATARVPPEILQTVQQHLEETARTVAQMDEQGPLWASLRESGLSLEILGWKFRFSVEPDKLVLTEAEPVPAQVT
jgi:hypothetical protein